MSETIEQLEYLLAVESELRHAAERHISKLQSEIDSYKVEGRRLIEDGDAKDRAIQRLRVERTELCDDIAACHRTIHSLSTGYRVAFTSGWSNATGHYSGKQAWNLERCWEQFLKDKEEVR